MVIFSQVEKSSSEFRGKKPLFLLSVTKYVEEIGRI